MKPEHMLLQDDPWSSVKTVGFSVVWIAGGERKR